MKKLIKCFYQFINYLVQERISSREFFYLQKIWYFIKEPLVSPLKAWKNLSHLRRLKPRSEGRIFFDVYYPFAWGYMKPVYEELKRRGLDVLFSIPSGKYEKPVKDMLFREKIESTEMISSSAVVLSRGGIFVTTRAGFIRSPRKAIHIQMFHEAAFKGHTILSPFNLCANHVFLQNYVDWELLSKKKKETNSKTQLHQIGFPKSDILLKQNLNRETAIRDLGLDPEKKTILFAPSWDSPGALHRFGKILIQKLAESSFNVLIRLHPFSYDVSNPYYSGGEDWKRILGDLESRYPLVQRAQNIFPGPYFYATDLMISDVSSVMAEFSVFQKPIIRIKMEQIDKLPYYRGIKFYEKAIKEIVRVIPEDKFEVEELPHEIETVLSGFKKEVCLRPFFYNLGESVQKAADQIEIIGNFS